MSRPKTCYEPNFASFLVITFRHCHIAKVAKTGEAVINMTETYNDISKWPYSGYLHKCL